MKADGGMRDFQAFRNGFVWQAQRYKMRDFALALREYKTNLFFQGSPYLGRL